MGDDHVAPDELLGMRDSLADDLPVVRDELEVEIRDEHARVAFAARGLADVTQPALECEVAALDRVLQERAIDGLGDRIDERRVAFELGQAEHRPDVRDHGAHQVGQDVLGMVELGPGQEAGVSGDVGNDEAGGLGLAEHLSRHHEPSSVSVIQARGG